MKFSNREEDFLSQFFLRPPPNKFGGYEPTSRQLFAYANNRWEVCPRRWTVAAKRLVAPEFIRGKPKTHLHHFSRSLQTRIRQQAADGFGVADFAVVQQLQRLMERDGHELNGFVGFGLRADIF